MSKLRCECGNVISDTTDYLPYKADLLPDQSFFLALDQIDELFLSLIEATRNNERGKWIEERLGKDYPKDLTDKEMIGDIFSGKFIRLTRRMYQCEQCGRILIQGKNKKYYSFKPEDDDWQNILSAD